MRETAVWWGFSLTRKSNHQKERAEKFHQFLINNTKFKYDLMYNNSTIEETFAPELIIITREESPEKLFWSKFNDERKREHQMTLTKQQQNNKLILNQPLIINQLNPHFTTIKILESSGLFENFLVPIKA